MESQQAASVHHSLLVRQPVRGQAAQAPPRPPRLPVLPTLRGAGASSRWVNRRGENPLPHRSALFLQPNPRALETNLGLHVRARTEQSV